LLNIDNKISPLGYIKPQNPSVGLHLRNSNKQQLILTKLHVTEFDDRFSNLLATRCTKFHSDSFRFDISIVRCRGGYFFPGTVYLRRKRSVFLQRMHDDTVGRLILRSDISGN